ncbi:MAG: hypothetical protein EZS28_015048 [Streblomastix strix]|uniref:Uncharacterized protein n=1 Tax=Streblomastix strix TaxID=222440 RepID=A0A5J4W3M3_9EUKA|nr:MAG: hypothetical protein EZS28_015048 [Streblomastix strix]
MTQTAQKIVNLNNNHFQDNQRAQSSSNYGCDISVIYRQFTIPSNNWREYCQTAVQGSTSNKPLSVYYIPQQSNEDTSEFFNLQTDSGECWDSQYESGGNYDGCICTPQGHPINCACPYDNTDYSEEQCQFDKLPTCSGDSEPTGGCKCSSSNYPSYCLCPLNDDSALYTQTQCEQEKEIANTPIECTGTLDKPNCFCPSDDLDPTYTKTQCDYDKLSICDSDTTPSEGCKCTNNNHPNNCACPLNNDVSYTKEKCEIDTKTQKSEDIDISPEEKQDSPSEESKFAWWGILIIVVFTLAILGISVAIIYYFIQIRPENSILISIRTNIVRIRHSH